MSMFYYFGCAEISFTEGYRVDKKGDSENQKDLYCVV